MRSLKDPPLSLDRRRRQAVNVEKRIHDELLALGLQPKLVEGETPSGHQCVVIFAYGVPTGRFRGQKLMVGLSTQCDAIGYPEVPPHWIFLSPPVLDTRDGPNHGVFSLGGEEWVALSRPPGAFWDQVRHKGMKAYTEHLNKVLHQI